MPLLVPARELQPGMRLADALVHAGRVMLPRGRTLSAEDVGAVRRRFPDTRLRVGDPVLDEVVKFENDQKDREVAAEVQQRVARAMSQVHDRLASKADLRGMNFAALQDAVTEIMQYLKDNPVSSALLTRELASEGYLSEHTGNVFYLCMVLGSAVKDYVSAERQRQTSAKELSPMIALNLTPLGLGAMFMDLGMAGLQDLFRTNRELTDEDRRILRDHPNIGADMLPDSIGAATKMVVRTHHENMDGTGYPNGIPGDRLHVFTRIVRLADSFDAGTSQQVYKEAKSSSRMLWEMSRGPVRHYYDPVLVKVLLSLIPPFPIGARLGLMDGRSAVVVRHNRRTPFSPELIIAFDTDGRRIPADHLEPTFTLDERPDLHLHSFGDEDLSYLNDPAPVDEPRPVRKREFQTLFEAAVP